MLSKESALNDLDCVDKLLGMIAPILKDPPNEDGGDGDAAMQVRTVVRGVNGVQGVLRWGGAGHSVVIVSCRVYRSVVSLYLDGVGCL